VCNWCVRWLAGVFKFLFCEKVPDMGRLATWLVVHGRDLGSCLWLVHSSY
jgi:hypothetical protein